PSFPFYKEIVWMHQRGITTGYWDGTFRPHDPVNRDAMAAFFYRYAGAPGYTAPVNSPFNDVQNGDAFYQEITWLKQQGITKGWSDGTYRPGEPIHRDAMAAFIHRYSAIVKK
ncbi:S-layer homology domain-containing protein, partial [Rothia aeria]